MTETTMRKAVKITHAKLKEKAIAALEEITDILAMEEAELKYCREINREMAESQDRLIQTIWELHLATEHDLQTWRNVFATACNAYARLWGEEWGEGAQSHCQSLLEQRMQDQYGELMETRNIGEGHSL